MNTRHIFAATALSLLGMAMPAYADSQTNTAKGDSWESSVTTGAKYTSWRRTKGDPAGMTQKGSQWTAPLDFEIKGRPVNDWAFAFEGKTAYYDSHRSLLGGMLKGSHSGITDTLVKGRAAYLGYGVVPFYELGFNLPTGDSSLLGNAKFSRMDPDLVDLPSYGEGFNVIQTAGVVVPVSFFSSLTAGVGHTYRGTYNKEDFADDSFKVDPGNVFRALLAYNYKRDALAFGLTGNYAYETEMRLNGAKVFQSGDRYGLNGDVSYSWVPGSTSSIGAGYSYTSTDDVAVGGALAKEPFNTNGPSFVASLGHAEALSDALTLGGRLGYMRRYENEWSQAVADFLPARTKHSFGMDLTYRPSETVSASLTPQIFRMKDEDRPAMPTPAHTYFGYAVGAGVNISF